MLPLSDGVAARRFPVVNVLLIVANFAVFLFYELPNLNSAVYHASFYPCAVQGACRAPEPWGVSWITAKVSCPFLLAPNLWVGRTIVFYDQQRGRDLLRLGDQLRVPEEQLGQQDGTLVIGQPSFPGAHSTIMPPG